MINLKEKYIKEVIPAMKEKFGYKSALAVPRIKKVVINTSFGRLVAGKTKQESEKIYKDILEDLALLTGQKPILTLAKNSISSFKIREGAPIGAKITLRKKMMNDFLERLINLVLPRTRDFAGISPKSIDREGNLTIGIKEHIIFPEVSDEGTRRIFGLEVTVITNARNREENLELFKLLGFPIKKSLSESELKGEARA